MKTSIPKRKKVECQYYVIPEKEHVLVLLGDEWRREYGDGISRLHFHNYIEVGICREGHGKVVLDESIYDYGPGNIRIVPPNIPHTTTVDPGTVAYWEWFYFDIVKIVDDMFVNEEYFFKREVIKRVYNSPHLLMKDDYPTIDRVLELIICEIKNKQSMYHHSIKYLIQILIVEVLRINGIEEKKEVKLYEMMQIRPAIEYVYSHYQNEIKISELSKVCNVSESHFRRVFYRCMNMRPLDYVNLIRVENACELLNRTGLSVAEISEQCGFGNVSTLTRNFKKIYDMTPYQWRQTSHVYDRKMK